jgi:hypothetical protein
MTVTAFNAMPVDDRIDAVEERGTFLLATLCDDHQHLYYRVDGLLVELVQVFEGLGIDEVEAFEPGDERMEFLLENIPQDAIEELFGQPPTSLN